MLYLASFECANLRCLKSTTCIGEIQPGKGSFFNKNEGVKGGKIGPKGAGLYRRIEEKLEKSPRSYFEFFI